MATNPAHSASLSSLLQFCTSFTGAPLVGQTLSPPAKSDDCSSSQFSDDAGSGLRSALRSAIVVFAATCRRVARAFLPTSSSICTLLCVNGTLTASRPMVVSCMRVSNEIW